MIADVFALIPADQFRGLELAAAVIAAPAVAAIAATILSQIFD